MKKLLIKSLIISGIINVVGCLVNFLCAKIWDFLLIYVHLSGGELERALSEYSNQDSIFDSVSEQQVYNVKNGRQNIQHSMYSRNPVTYQS